VINNDGRSDTKQSEVREGLREAGMLLVVPPPPEGMVDPDARAVWNDTCSYLVSAKLLASGDLTMVARFSFQVAMATKMERQIFSDGVIGEDGSLHELVKPYREMVNNARLNAITLCLFPQQRLLSSTTRRAPDVESEAESPLGRLLAGASPGQPVGLSKERWS
jgi:phage terminase small subunit